MSKPLDSGRLNLQAFAQSGAPLVESTLLKNMERLAQEAQAPQPDSTINWQARAELRPGATSEGDVWLHLAATTSLALTCQRCMGTVTTPLQVDQWYRFVATEDIAMAEDDASEEDLLVMTPRFDLLAVLEDELLMALPLVPMHEQCPVPPLMRTGEGELAAPDTGKVTPFAMLAQLKKKER